ncbi:MAG TPA: hypothetical protein PKJ99_09480 [Thermoanaerobaculales bacterium]|nr:hypothetical protein [Thermoanaerobaculales bacterium]HQP37538.1 hypothetical protein [Polyangiaceae bacterium]
MAFDVGSIVISRGREKVKDWIGIDKSWDAADSLTVLRGFFEQQPQRDRVRVLIGDAGPGYVKRTAILEIAEATLADAGTGATGVGLPGTSKPRFLVYRCREKTCNQVLFLAAKPAGDVLCPQCKKEMQREQTL